MDDSEPFVYCAFCGNEVYSDEALWVEGEPYCCDACMEADEQAQAISEAQDIGEVPD